MVLLIFTEATLFAILLTSYFFVRFQSSPVWPPDGIEKPKLSLVLVMTPILLLSSAPIHLASVGIRSGKQGRLRAGLFVTFLLGLAFLMLQGVEFADTLNVFTPRTNAYGSMFFSITGFHGIHVAVGLSMLLWLQVGAWRGRFTARSHGPVEVITMYWHFVDAVWVFILASLYLSPHFWP